ncbi:hypothetical protein [Terrihabitans sp. B22-R8]|uniref:hypothetical protein n=1 Tax=Terrihabitans sp. B22-R8 TaxID=3425128 RepID=UPI00403C3EAA
MPHPSLRLARSALLGQKPGMRLFSLGRRDEAAAEKSRAIAAKVRQILGMGEEDGVTVSQIACGDPACAGGAETVLLVMRKGRRTQAAKIRKALAFVEDSDIHEALSSLQD